MKKSHINKSLNEFKQLFSDRHQQVKKIRALENYSQVAPVRHTSYIELLKGCLEQTFLENKEKEFLDHLIDKYELQSKYYMWCHKTKWIKGQLHQASRARELRENPQLSFKMPDLATLPYKLPIGMLLRMKKARSCGPNI